MATTLHRIPLEEINERARQASFARTLLTLIAALLFALGWCAAKTFKVAWLAAAWSAAAVAVGWNQARSGGARGPS